MNQILAKKADVDTIFLPCPEGGRSLMNLEKKYKATMVGLHKYMMKKEDSWIQAVLRHQTANASLNTQDRSWNKRSHHK